MGKGKGFPDVLVYKIKAGTILFEIDGVLPLAAKIAIEKACFKLPVKSIYIGL